MLFRSLVILNALVIGREKQEIEKWSIRLNIHVLKKLVLLGCFALKGSIRKIRYPIYASDRVWVFFFFFFFSRIRADSARFAPTRLRFAPNRADSAKIGPYRPYRTYRPAADTADTAETGRKSAETGRNRPETAEIGLEYGCKIRNLHSSFFFCESRPSMCF